MSGRWVWRGSGGRGAHLVRERSAGSCNPWALCGRRVRNPRLAWRSICPDCRRIAAVTGTPGQPTTQLTTGAHTAGIDAEPTPAPTRTPRSTPVDLSTSSR
ncbi:hypothetical protein [Kineococcus sp. SYSU DK006]|uniref:hypothetical protein n=1 Tax=Kineococcus sp. SYSU DK006 TaxID=3383127 RepID=UPI003D7D58D5